MADAHEAATAQLERRLGTDLLASLLIEQAATSPAPRQAERLTLKIVGVMAFTTLLTSATLIGGYQMLFTHSLFA